MPPAVVDQPLNRRKRLPVYKLRSESAPLLRRQPSLEMEQSRRQERSISWG